MLRTPLPLTLAIVVGAGALSITNCGNPEAQPQPPTTETTVKTTPVPYAELDWKDDLFFLEGKPFTGTAISYHKDGATKKSEFVFLAGKYHGTVREWWENGAANTETEFAEGVRHGKNTYWDKEGKLIKEQVYENGNVTFEKVHQ